LLKSLILLDLMKLSPPETTPRKVKKNLSKKTKPKPTAATVTKLSMLRNQMNLLQCLS